MKALLLAFLLIAWPVSGMEVDKTTGALTMTAAEAKALIAEIDRLIAERAELIAILNQAAQKLKTCKDITDI